MVKAESRLIKTEYLLNTSKCCEYKLSSTSQNSVSPASRKPMRLTKKQEKKVNIPKTSDLVRKRSMKRDKHVGDEIKEGKKAT